VAALPVLLTLQRTREPALATPALALRLRLWSTILHLVAGALIVGTAIAEIWLSLQTAGPWLFGVYGAAAAVAVLALGAFYLSFVAEQAPKAPKPPKEKKPKRKRGKQAEAEVEVEAEAEGEGEETPPVEAPAAPAAPVAPVNRAGTFTMRGVQTTDQAAVQAHINELEAFYDETRSSNRTSFIASLAAGESPKILATQITAMEELVATMSDKQYEMWVASWDAAPSVGLLQPHASTGGGQPSGTAAEAAADRVEVLKGIVTRHQMASMHPDKIKATDSYKELIQLQPDFTL